MGDSESFDQSDVHVADNYHKVKTIGQGKFGCVILYRTQDRVTDPYVILKYVCDKYILGTDAEHTIKKQITDLQNVVHVNVVAYLDFMFHPDCKQCGIKMEYLPNGSLKQLLNKSVSMPWSLAVSILRDVTRGLGYLHTNMGSKERIVHENLNLSNILLTKNFTAKVTDYALKATYAETREYASSMPEFDDVRFRAPEKVRDISSELSEATDIYAFGIVDYCVLCGKSEPFSGLKEDDIIDRLKQGKSVVGQCMDDEMKPNCPNILVDILLQTTKDIPEERPTFTGVHRQLETKGRDLLATLADDVENFKLVLSTCPNEEETSVQSTEPDDSLKKPWSSPRSNSPNSRSQTLSFPRQASEQETGDATLNSPGTSEDYPQKNTYQQSALGATAHPEQDEPVKNIDYEGSSGSSSFVSLHRPPQIELGPEDDVSLSVQESGEGDSYPDHPSMHPVHDMTDAMRHLNIQPHPNLGQNTQPSTGALPQIPGNLPNFHSAVPGPGQNQAPLQSQRIVKVTSPNGGQEKNLQIFQNGIPGSAGGDSSATINIKGQRVVMLGDNSQVTVIGKPKTKKKAAPPTEHQQKIIESSRQLTDADIDVVGERLGKKWRDLGRKLGFEDGQLDQIDHDYHGEGLKEKIVQLLIKWREKQAQRATVGKLANNLRRVKRLDIVEKLKV